MRRLYVGDKLLNDVIDAVKIEGNDVDGVILIKNGVETTVWDKLIPESAPPIPTDFSASDNIDGAIRFTWTENLTVDLFAVYEEIEGFPPNIVIPNAHTGDHILVNEYTGTYFVRAINSYGYTDSPPDDGTAAGRMPIVVTNLTPVGGPGYIDFTFDYVPQKAKYNLFRNGILHRAVVYSPYHLQSPAGTWDFTVQTINEHGSVMSDPSVPGTATDALLAPVFPVDAIFIVNTDSREISLDFTTATDAARYDLWRSDDSLSPLATDVYPGWTDNSPSGTWDFYVIAHNAKGTDTSPVDTDVLVNDYYTDIPAESPANFAVEGQTNGFTFTFTRVLDAVTYDVIRYTESMGDGGIWQSNVNSGETYRSRAGAYQFVLAAVNPKGARLGSPVEAEATSSNTLPVDITLTATGGPGYIDLIWEPTDPLDEENAYVYDVYNNDSVPPVFLESVFGNSYRQPTEEYALSQCFFIRSVNYIGTDDSNESCALATIPGDDPSPIVSFQASDNQPGQVYMSYTTEDLGTLFVALYQNDGSLVGLDISPGHIVDPLYYTEGVADTYYAIGYGTEHRYSTSDSDTGFAKLPLTGFLASSTEEHEIIFTWDDTNPIFSTFDLYEMISDVATHLTSDVHSGHSQAYSTYKQAIFFVRGNLNVSGVDYISDSGTDEGIANPVPDIITNFSATDSGYSVITCTWTEGGDTTEVDLYYLVGDVETLIAANTASGYDWTPPSNGITYTLFVRSRNATFGGSTKCDPVNTGKVLITYETVTLYNDRVPEGDTRFISGSYPNFTFTHDSLTRNIKVSAGGAGGGGGGGGSW